LSIAPEVTRVWAKFPWFTRVFCLVSLLLFTGFIYAPGLDSHFLLDDRLALSGLGNIKEYGIVQYVLDGATGSSGRPVSSLTFALQHQQWPDNPFQFKLVNFFIHLLNGCLVFFLARFIFNKIQSINIKSRSLDEQSSRQVDLFALIVTALWLLHPMQTSTVLYVVQRMTQLSAFFTLLGLTGYLIYREIYEKGDAIRGLRGMSLSVFFATLLGVLAKENGILLPLYVLVIEATLYSSCPRTKIFKYWASLFLVSPLLILVAYLVMHFDGHLAKYAYRPFSMGERLLTQPVVLIHYLSDILLPHFKTFTLFHDDFPISKGLLTPPLTVIAILICGSLIICAIAKRKIWPIVSFGLLWFFAGHTLESSHIGLELYFDHRNYLPSLGIFVVLVWLLFRATQFVDKRILFFISFIYFSLLTLTTLIEAKTWADPLKQAIVWQKMHPGSIRAISNLLNMNLKQGHIEEAKKIHKKLSRMMPGDAYLFIKEITISYCFENKPLKDKDWQEIIISAQSAKVLKISGSMAFSEINNLLTNVEKGYCMPAHIPRFALLTVVLAQNPEFKQFRPQLHQIAAFMLVQAGDAPAALANIEEALKFQKTPTRFVLKFQLLMVQEEWAEAEEVLVEFDVYLKHNKKKNIGYRKILDEMTMELSGHIQ